MATIITKRLNPSASTLIRQSADEEQMERHQNAIKSFQKGRSAIRSQYGKFSSKKPAYLKGKSVSASKMGTGLGAFLTGGNQAISGNAGYSQGGGSMGPSGRGRGRPTSSYRYVIPGVGPVPIQAYKRFQSQQRSMMRVQAELQKANLINQQPSYNEMPVGYGQFSAEDAFMGQEGPNAMQMLQQQQMQAQMARQAQMQVNQGQPQGQSFMSRIFQRQNPQQQMVPRPPMTPGNMQQVPRMSIWGGNMTLDPRNNILNTPNVFNKQGQTTIGVARQQQGY